MTSIRSQHHFKEPTLPHETSDLLSDVSPSEEESFYGGISYLPEENATDLLRKMSLDLNNNHASAPLGGDDQPPPNGMICNVTTPVGIPGRLEPTQEEVDVLIRPPPATAPEAENERFSLSAQIEPSVPDRPEDPFERSDKLSVLPFAVIVFYNVSGGPFGVEETVRSAGNFYSLLGFLIMPFVWSMQEALMTAELGSVFPEASGGVAWVQAAFGDGAGWMCGYLGWVAGATDNAIYPVLFVEYLLEVVNGNASSIPFPIKFLMLSGISCVLAYMNWLGLELVGKMSMTICFVALSPFIILALVGVFQVDPQRWFELPDEIGGDEASSSPSSSAPVGLFSLAALQRIAWTPFLNNLFWNLNSFDSAASFAADIQEPARTLPRAMGLAFFLVSTSYFFPLLIALGASTAKQSDWVNGYLSVVAKQIAGPWLEGWLVFAAGISNIGLFQAELSADAFQLMGLAERGYLPEIFATRSWHGTPTYGILVGLLVIICMTMTNLDNLIEMLNFNYSLALLLEYFAFLSLRITRPDMERPYRVPLNTVGCFFVFGPAILATMVVICLASWKTLLFGVGVNIFGLLLFLIRKVSGASAKQHSDTGQVEYDAEPEDEMGVMNEVNGHFYRDNSDDKDDDEIRQRQDRPDGELA